MQTNAEKVRENRVRRKAKRQRLELHRSPRRDTDAFDYGAYWLTDPHNGNALVAGLPEFGWSLDDIESWLTSRRAA
jgi:hypothetical protein